MQVASVSCTSKEDILAIFQPYIYDIEIQKTIDIITNLSGVI
jgi:hypothetical protein